MFSNKWSYIFISFFVIHALGYFFSINKAEALSSIEIKLPFIFLPFLIFTSNFNELRADFPSCDFVGNDRYVFNIKGNRYRLIAIIHFDIRTVYIRFLGTHAAYDKIKDIQNI